jgi:hypothetical protein
VQLGNWRLVAQRIQGRRIGRVLISRVAQADGSAGGQTDGDHGDRGDHGDQGDRHDHGGPGGSIEA